MQGRNYVIGIGVLILALIGIYGAGVWHVHKISNMYTGAALPLDETKTLAATDLKTIHVSVDGAYVHVHPVDGAVATVHAYGSVQTPSLKNVTFQAALKDSAMNVVLEQNNAANRGKENLTLDIAVPKNSYSSIQVLSGSGKVDVGSLIASRTDIETSGSPVSVANMTTNLTVNDGGGSILVNNVGGKLDLQTGQGNVTVHESSFKEDVNVTVDAGNVVIDVKTPPQNVRFQLTTQIGKLVSNLPGQKFIRSEPGNAVGYVGKGGPIVEASSNDGNVSLVVAK